MTTLDERGVLCPLPVIHLARAILELTPGEVIEVLCDDPAAATDIPAWCSMRDQDFVSATSHAEHTSYLVRRR